MKNVTIENQNMDTLGLVELNYSEAIEIVGGENDAAWSLGYMAGAFVAITTDIMEGMLGIN
jgi:hypothetical protein